MYNEGQTKKFFALNFIYFIIHLITFTACLARCAQNPELPDNLWELFLQKAVTSTGGGFL